MQFNTTTVAGTMAEQLAGRLVAYRNIVAAAARGEPVSGDDARVATKHLRAIGLPGYAFERDVRAFAGAGTARGYRLLELTVNHPHLFNDADAWVRGRMQAATRRHQERCNAASRGLPHGR